MGFHEVRGKGGQIAQEPEVNDPAKGEVIVAHLLEEGPELIRLLRVEEEARTVELLERLTGFDVDTGIL